MLHGAAYVLRDLYKDILYFVLEVILFVFNSVSEFLTNKNVF